MQCGFSSLRFEFLFSFVLVSKYINLHLFECRLQPTSVNFACSPGVKPKLWLSELKILYFPKMNLFLLILKTKKSVGRWRVLLRGGPWTERLRSFEFPDKTQSWQPIRALPVNKSGLGQSELTRHQTRANTIKLKLPSLCSKILIWRGPNFFPIIKNFRIRPSQVFKKKMADGQRYSDTFSSLFIEIA